MVGIFLILQFMGVMIMDKMFLIKEKLKKWQLRR